MGIDFWNDYGASKRAQYTPDMNSQSEVNDYIKSGAFTDTTRTDAERQLYGQMGAQNQAWNAPQLGSASTMGAAYAGPGQTAKGFDPTAQNQARSFQTALMGQLQNQANGVGPSLAGGQLQQGVEASLRAQQAAAASSRGRSGFGLAARNLGNQASAMQGNAAMQAAQLRMAEQQSAQQQLGNVAGATRGQDLGYGGMQNQMGQFNAAQQNQFGLANAGFQQGANQFNAGAQNQFSLANQQAAIAGQQTKNQFAGQLLGMGQAADFNDVSRRMGLYDAQERSKVRAADMAAGERNRQDAAVAGTIGTMAKVATAASDERVKTDVKSGDAKLKSFLSALGTHSYKYKGAAKTSSLGGSGEYVSPMAQELEKTDLGKHMVSEDATGTKIVDYGKGFGAMLASQAMQQREIESLKAALRRKTK